MAAVPVHKQVKRSGKKDTFCATKPRGTGSSMKYTSKWEDVTCTRCIAKNKNGAKADNAE